MASGFRWLIARRYLRRTDRRPRPVSGLTLTLIGLTACAWLAALGLDHARTAWLQDARVLHGGQLRYLKVALLGALVLVEFFLALVRRLTIFTTISTYGLFLGSSALVIVLSVMSGFEMDLKQKILGANAHIVVTTPDRPFTRYSAARNQLIHLPGVVGVTPYLSSEVMISSSSNLAGVMLKAIDPATVGQVTDLKRNIDVGDLDSLDHPEKLRSRGGPAILKHEDEEPGAPAPGPGAIHFAEADGRTKIKLPEAPTERRVLPGVIVGRELARDLRLYVGDDVNIASPLGGIGPSGVIPKSKPFRVAGIFFSGMYEYDHKYIYMSIPAAQRFLGQAEEVTGLELKVFDVDRTEQIVEAIKRLLGPDFDVQDWKELNRNLFSALKLEKIAMFIVLCFIILVAAFSIVANGIMLVMEKGREIAILKSMGASDGTILSVFLILGLYMGGLGTVVGIAVGVLSCLALGHFGLSLDPDVYYITQLPVKMNPYEILAVFGAAVLLALLATLYPALVAARLRPVEGLRAGNH